MRELFVTNSTEESINPLFRLVPENPENTLSASNVLVVQSAIRKKLVKAFAEGGAEQYHNALMQWVEKV